VSIPASAQIAPLQAPQRAIPFVDSKNNLTSTAFASLQSLLQFVQGICRFIPCNASTVSNVITLTMLDTSPLVTKYADFDTFRFVADVTSTGNLSALVVTPQGTLATLNVFKNNGGTQATTGDVTINRQYDLTFVDSLSSGTGGFVLR
jgi:hypothetical protein